MKILLRKGHHSVYDDLARYPPKGITYTIPNMVTESKSKTVDMVKKKVFTAYTELFNRPHEVYVSPGKSQLIHACSGIMIKNKFPWVIDTEHAASFVGFKAGRIEKIRNHIEYLLRSEYCKKIMPWSYAGETSILNSLNTKGFEDKIETVYPAMQPLTAKKKKHDGMNLLFVSVRFFTKGGKEVLEAYDKLKKKYDFKLTIISDVPHELKNKYRNDKNIVFHSPTIPRQRVLDEFFSTTDIFVLPSYMDTFGMVFLEAMSYKLPIIATNVFAIPEIIKNSGIAINVDKYSWYGKDCLFAWKSWEEFCRHMEKEDKPDISKSIAINISKLIEDGRLRKKLGNAGRFDVEKGKFSIENRNKKLKRIYEEAIK